MAPLHGRYLGLPPGEDQGKNIGAWPPPWARWVWTPESISGGPFRPSPVRPRDWGS